MAIRLKVRLNKQIVVPVRFARAVFGATQDDAPDVDDRGFGMGARPGTWGTSDARGAMVSVQEGDVIRVKVAREDLEFAGGGPAGELFVTSTNPSMASVEGPAGPLNASGIFRLKGVKDSKNVTVKIQARLGSADGPVLGELEPHIFQPRELRVRAHIISINPPASGPDAASTTSQTPASLVDVFDGANRIFRAAGIKFLYNQAETRFGSISGFATQGTMTTNLSANPPTFGEFSKLINLVDKKTGDKPDPNAINVYFIRNANEVLGLTFDHDVGRPDGFGVVIADFQVSANGNTTANPDFGRVTAHELGHYLDSDVHADQNAAAKNIRSDIVSRRRMMFSAATIRANTEPAYRREMGYGALTPGNLITVKDLGPDPNDGEVARNRRRALNPN